MACRSARFDSGCAGTLLNRPVQQRLKLPMPAPSIPREEVVRRLLGCFQKHGYDGASLAELSKATGLGKSSLYHYFPGGKQDMALAVLDEIDRWMSAHALGRLKGPGAPRQRLSRMVAALDGFYDSGRCACVLGNLTVGDSRRLFQRRLRAAFAAWIDALRDLAVEAGHPPAQARLWAQDLVLGIEGALVLARGLDDPAPFRHVLRRCMRTLVAHS